MTRPATAPASGSVLALLPALALALAPIPAAALLACEREQRDLGGPTAGMRALPAPAPRAARDHRGRGVITGIAESPAALEAWSARQREPASAPAGAVRASPASRAWGARR